MRALQIITSTPSNRNAVRRGILPTNLAANGAAIRPPIISPKMTCQCVTPIIKKEGKSAGERHKKFCKTHSTYYKPRAATIINKRAGNNGSPPTTAKRITAAKCVLTIASAITFIFTIGIHHWNIVAGLLIGDIITAPFSAMLTAKLPVRKMFIAVGIVVICCSLITLYRSIFL